MILAQTAVARAQRAAEELALFLDLLVQGDLAQARARTTPGFTWFGRPPRWQPVDPPLAEHRQLREVPRALVVALSPDLFDGPVGEEEHVLLADVRRGDRWVSVGAVVAVRGRTAALRRVFDPTPLAAALTRLAPEDLGA